MWATSCEVGAGLALAERHPQGVEHQVGAHVGGQLPADDLAGEGVDHEGEERRALPGAQVGEVADPEPVGALGAEVALDQVGPAVGLGVGFCRAPGLPTPLGALDPGLSHQPLPPGRGRPPRRRAAGRSTSAGSRRRSSWPRGSRRSGRAGARPRGRELSARPWRAGSRRRPTPPGSCRSARPRSARGAPRYRSSLRSAWVELGGEKGRRRLQDVVGPAQLAHLTA